MASGPYERVTGCATGIRPRGATVHFGKLNNGRHFHRVNQGPFPDFLGTTHDAASSGDDLLQSQRAPFSVHDVEQVVMVP